MAVSLIAKYVLKLSHHSLCTSYEYNSITVYHYTFFFLWCCGPTGVMASSFLRFLDHTQRRTTVGRTPLDEWSSRRRDLYLTTHNTHNRQISMLPVGFEPTISAGERPQTYAYTLLVCWWNLSFLLCHNVAALNSHYLGDCINLREEITEILHFPVSLIIHKDMYKIVFYCQIYVL